MKPTGRALGTLLLAVVACATPKAQQGDERKLGAAESATPAPAPAPTPTATPTPTPTANVATTSAEAAPSEGALDPTTGASGEPEATHEAEAPDDSETTGEGLQTESLKTRASGRPDHPRTLEEIVKSGYIRVLTRNNDTSFFIYRGHRLGFDYELGKKLAQRLGIRVDMVITSDWNDMVPALLRGDGDVIASEVTVTEERKRLVLFADRWGRTNEVVVYRSGVAKIEKPEDLAGKKVAVRTGSSYVGSLRDLSDKLKADGKPEIAIDELSGDVETDTILEKVSKGELDYTVADDLLANIHVAFFENLAVGPAVNPERELAWAVRPGDEPLRSEINKLFHDLRRKPDFNILKSKYFEARRTFKKERKDKFYASGTGTLSPFDPLIRKYAETHGFDWRLVAAQIYQESRFDVTRKSWVGAIGLFQIMPKTARGLGIKNPTDPEQSIKGGLKYMKQLMSHYSDVTDDVERYRFAMAAYNSGFGHVDDARRLAREAGEDTGHWKTVSRWLLRLSKKQWFSKARFGFCRGFEPVDYVRHIDERYAGYAQLVPLKKPEEAKRD